MGPLLLCDHSKDKTCEKKCLYSFGDPEIIFSLNSIFIGRISWLLNDPLYPVEIQKLAERFWQTCETHQDCISSSTYHMKEISCSSYCTKEMDMHISLLIPCHADETEFLAGSANRNDWNK